MQLTYALNPSALPVGNATTVDLLLTLRPASSGPQEPRRPLNLGLVIDRSGSMAGNSLKQALKAAETLVNHLGPDDVVSLVVYDDKVDTILPPTNVTDKAYPVNVTNGYNSAGFDAYVMNQPRMWGLRMRYSFGN